MKYIVIVGDGMADYSLEELNGKTPLQSANIPNMDRIAKNGKNGTIKTIPDSMEAGSDVGNLSILGYNPEIYYTGRGPLEAAGIGLKFDEDDVIFRCNLITELNNEIIDHAAGHITTKEAKILIELLDEKIGKNGVKFHMGISYRHILSLKCKDGVKCAPPHDVIGQSIYNNMPTGDDGFLKNLIVESKSILEKHEINIKRKKEGKRPANMIWPWGQGKLPKIPLFKEKYGLSGSVISAVYLIKGIGRSSGMDVVDVPGATGYLDTSYENKAKYAIKSLKKNDFVFVHVEAPDEAAHMGNLEEKLKAIERVDFLVGYVLDKLKEPYKILVLPDHFTPIPVKTHTREPVPFAIYSSEGEGDSVKSYDEESAKKGSFGEIIGENLMDVFMAN